MLVYNKANKQVIEGHKVGETKYTIKVETYQGLNFTLQKSDVLIKPEILDDPYKTKLIIESLDAISQAMNTIESLELELEKIMMPIN